MNNRLLIRGAAALALVAFAAPASAQIHSIAPKPQGMTATALKTVKLGCRTDASTPGTIYVKNTTSGALAAGATVNWTLGAAQGGLSLATELAAGAEVSIDASPGTGSSCSASTLM